MAKFKWTGTNAQGKTVSGIHEATTVDQVADFLKVKKIRPDIISEKKAFGLGFLKDIQFGGGVTPKELVVFMRQFSTMIDAGLPLVQCLDILSSQQKKNLFFKNTLFDVKKDVESGLTFADSLAKHKKVFDSLTINLVRAGEVGGILDIILSRVAEYAEKSSSLRKKIKSAISYPIGIVFITSVIMVIMVKYVIPMFEKMFKNLSGKEGKLPALTQAVLDVSGVIENNAILILILLVGGIFGFKKMLKKEKGRFYFDKFMLKLPLVGSLIIKISVARFARTLGTLMTSGVPILESLEIVSTTVNNVHIKFAILNTRARVSEGKPMADPMSDSGLFPDMVCQMVRAGEAAGAVDQMLNKIADFYEEEVDNAVGALTSALEPIIMSVLGVVIGTVVIAMYMPVFQMAGGAGG
jgi:type IV pilus assembly protein PilC